jgi:four helix bundle protein
MRIRPYQRLIVWKEAHELCKGIYRLTDKFPSNEKFGLTSQMRRSAASIPMNIAEGNGKRSMKDRARFLEIAIGSLEELHYQCFLAKELGFLVTEQHAQADDLIQRVGFLLERLRASLL